MGKIDLAILNFLPNNFLRFTILQKIRYTAEKIKANSIIPLKEKGRR
jgi:hypothetical protein